MRIEDLVDIVAFTNNKVNLTNNVHSNLSNKSKEIDNNSLSHGKQDQNTPNDSKARKHRRTANQITKDF